ncbi:hypothetical protein D3C77_304220 [compost metagenome]
MGQLPQILLERLYKVIFTNFRTESRSMRGKTNFDEMTKADVEFAVRQKYVAEV